MHHLPVDHQRGHAARAQALKIPGGAPRALDIELDEGRAARLQPLSEGAAVSAAGARVERNLHCVRRRSASAYFAAVRSITSSGSSGPGGVLSQSRVSR